MTFGPKDWRNNVSFLGKKTLSLCASIALLGAFQNVHAKLKVGVTAGPHAEIMAFLKDEGKKEGLEIEVIEFNDFILPNTALSEGELDANSYQHEPFLKDQNETRGLKLASVAKTILLPLGIYAEKLTDLAVLPYGAKIAIPNDVTNGGRALRLLEKMGLLTLKPEAGLTPSVLDIATNPKHLKIVEVEAPQLPRVLPDVDIAVINTDWVLVSGLDPQKALAKEDTTSPYANILVAKACDVDKPEIKKLVTLYHSDATRKFIQSTFKGAVLPSWVEEEKKAEVPASPAPSAPAA